MSDDHDGAATAQMEHAQVEFRATLALKAAQADFEACFPAVVRGGTTRLAPTGEPYVEICSGGPKADSEPIYAYGTSAEAAISLWLEAVTKYAAIRPGALYWRIEPEIQSQTFLVEDYNKLTEVMRDAVGKRVFWMVYSRLLISDKPVA